MNKNTTNIKRHAYIVGGGIGGLATAFFLLRDGKMSGSDITIFEELELVGGSCDGKGTAKEGYLIRGGRMLNLPTYECLWAMLMDVPSLNDNEVSVYDEVVEFNRKWKIDVHARLIAKNQQIVNAKDMQFSVKDKLDLVKLMAVSEHSLGEKRISECFEASFFKTNFWYLWATTFAFQTWHSAVELRRYMYRFMHEFYRIYNLSGIHRTPYNQYDSFILPITKHLKKKGVHFKHNCAVTDLVIEEYLSEKKVTTIKCVDQKNEHSIKLEENDIVIATIGSINGTIKRSSVSLIGGSIS